jgi:hypothetical protein
MKVPCPGHAEGSPAWVFQRLVGPAVSSVLPSAILHRVEVGRFLPSLLTASATDLVPAFTRYHKKRINISLARSLRTASYEGSPSQGDPSKQPGGRKHPAPNRSPFWADGTLAGHMLKTCHAAEDVGMVAIFLPSTQDVFFDCMKKFFVLCLVINSLSLLKFLISSIFCLIFTNFVLLLRQLAFLRASTTACLEFFAFIVVGGFILHRSSSGG